MAGQTTAPPDEAFPPGFGIARIEETGTASHELIYEHEYFPLPVRKYDPYLPLGSLLMRPALRKGKAPFHFWGNRVPLSADHARCWLGHVLLTEVKHERLALVEFIVRTEKELLHLASDSGAAIGMGGAPRHCPHPDWLWHLWPVGGDIGVQNRSPVTELHMRMTANNGILMELRGDWEGALIQIYRVLHQYCDDDEGDSHWRPIPDPPVRISKVRERDDAPAVRRRQLIGTPAPETGGSVLNRSLDQWREAETRLVQAIDCLRGANNEPTDLSAVLFCCVELRDSLLKAVNVRLRLRPEWCEATNEALEALLVRLLEGTAIGSIENGESDVLADAVKLTVDICGLGIRPPECLETAQLQLQSREAPGELKEGSTEIAVS